ncbi:hypothetical protein BFF78_02370 [Streptomyces fodineus]|uniref:Uncharacterized protein n=1 Tax=Streptomyces fodineus TaxID=1904616 RepID=A0A1D7Y3W5_9ACTN|nr:hypothetical protein BFF78_02370 [Streptomyces fodineus]
MRIPLFRTGTPSSPASSGRALRLRRSVPAVAIASPALVLTLPAQADARVLQLLPQNADGTINPGLKPGGDVNGHCPDHAQLADKGYPVEEPRGTA